MTETQSVPVTLENNKDDDPKSDKDKNETIETRSDKNATQKNGTDSAEGGRRPMNAFLIFCKKHRSVVKKSYPNSENRVITKMLGDWWANLDSKTKECYKDLAIQNKNALYNANPDFKWYKLPAGKSKTCSTRPSNHNTSVIYPDDNSNSSHDSCDTKPKLNNNHIIKPNYAMQPSSSKINFEDKKPIFTPGKLADITQMGSLNSLMNFHVETDNVAEKPVDASNTDEEKTSKRTHLSDMTVPLPPFKKRRFCESSYSEDSPEKIDAVKVEKDPETKKENNINRMKELQDELSETSRHFKLLNSSSESSSIDDFQCESNVSSKLCYEKGESSNDCDDSYGKSAVNDFNVSDFDEANNNWGTKSGRSCKGKRYKEFMNTGCLLAHKRAKRNPDSFKHADDYADANNDEKNKQSELPRKNMSLCNNDSKNTLKSACNRSEENANSNEIKPFISCYFDLESKIKTLPTLNFQEFMQKKKEDKKNKTSTKLKEPKLKTRNNIFLNKERSLNSINTDIEEPIENIYELKREERLRLAEKYKNSIKGSKKRKPKKISITRLNVNSHTSNGYAENANAINNCTNTVEPTSISFAVNQIPMNQFDTSALDTLAAVAATLI